ncbi:MAG: glycosyltransferase [Deltaproteobacteria bacterium]|nr:glycosyltransferase [Deltaproteobacteria bacterium]
MKRVLIISQILPFKSHNGGSTQVRNLILALRRRDIVVDFVSFDLPKADDSSNREVKSFLRHHTRKFFIIPFAKYYKSSLLTCEGSIGFFSEKMDDTIKRLSQHEYVSVFAEFTSMGYYMSNFKGIPKIINIHELNFLRQVREKSLNYNLKDKAYLLLDAIKSAKIEIRLLDSADVILSYNKIEVELLKIFMPKKLIAKIPLTIYIPKKVRPLEEREFDFVFIGNFEHKPNRDSVEFILNHYKKILGNKSLLIGGRNIDLLKHVHSLPNNIRIIESVSNPHSFFQMGRILLYPATTGGGARVKVIEAFANGNLVITTPIGAEGLTSSEKEGVFILKPYEFTSSKPLEIAENFSKYIGISEKNRKYAESHHNIDASLEVREFFIN